VRNSKSHIKNKGPENIVVLRFGRTGGAKNILAAAGLGSAKTAAKEKLANCVWKAIK